MATSTRSKAGEEEKEQQDAETSSNEFKVLTHVLVYRTGKDGKQVVRAKRGDKVALNPEYSDIERLKSLHAIGDEDAQFPTPAGVAHFANDTYGQARPTPANQDGTLPPAPDEADARSGR